MSGSDITINTDYNWKGKFFSFLIPLLPFLDVYELGFAPVSISEVLLIFFILISVSGSLYFSSKNYVVFIVYAFITSLILNIFGDYFSFSDWFFKWIRIGIYSYTFLCLSKKYIEIGELSKFFTRFGLVESILQIFQAIAWYVFHYSIILIIPFLKLHYVISDYNEYVTHIMEYGGSVWRPSGLFLEPADLALYGCLALICCLFYSEKPKIKIALIITISVLMSLSSFGIILILIIWLYWVFKANKNNAVYKLSSIFIVFSALIILIINGTIASSVFYRIGTIGQSGSTTGSLRLLRGLAIFNQLSNFHKMFGVGLGDLDTYLIKFGVTTQYDTTLKPGNEYMNTMSYILVNTGLVGFGIYLSFIVSIFIKFKAYYKRILIISWVIICISNSNFLNISYILPLVILYGRDDIHSNMLGENE